MQWLVTKPFNLIAFNLMWIGCVIGREQWLWLVAPVVLAYVILLIVRGGVKPYQLLVPASIGIAIDSSLTLTGVFAFEGSPLILPFWLVVLWLAFSTTLVKSLSVFGKNKFIAAAAGAIAFPLNYSVGERLGAVEFSEGYLLALVLLSLIWALCLPLLFMITEGTLERSNAPI